VATHAPLSETEQIADRGRVEISPIREQDDGALPDTQALYRRPNLWLKGWKFPSAVRRGASLTISTFSGAAFPTLGFIEDR
jgi:hypothetical protein